MALRFIDSFDHYASGDFTEKWQATAGTVSVSAGNGRRGTSACRCSITSYLQLTLDAQPTWIVGMAMRLTSLPGGPCTILQWLDGSTAQADIAIVSTGALTIRGGSGATLGTSSNVLSLNTVYYLEFRVLVGNAGIGQADIRIDGVPWLSLTGVDTQTTANATANVVRCGTVVGGVGTFDMDDLYICDGTGGAPQNTFLGDCRVDVLVPSGDGSNSAWTPSTGTTHSTLVDEVPANDDTDYLSTLTVAARETHVFPDLPAMTNPLVLGVQHVINARKDDAGTRQLKSIIKSGATTQAGPTTHTMASTYAYYREMWPTDPATGLAWTVPGVNALEAGFDNLV